MTQKKLFCLLAAACAVIAGFTFIELKPSDPESEPVASDNVPKPENPVERNLMAAGPGATLPENTAAKSQQQKQTEEEPPLTIAELQSADLDFASAAEINDFIDDMENMPNAALRPAIEALKKDPLLRREWLENLSLAEDDEVPVGAETILPTVPKDEFVDFAKQSLAYGSDAAIDVTITALSRRADVDTAGANLTTPVVDALRNSTNPYTKINAMRALTNQPETYSDSERQPVETVIEGEFLSENDQIRASAVNAMLRLNTDHPEIEAAILYEISNNDPDIRQKALGSMDPRMELGLEPTAALVNSTHRQALRDLSGDMEFRDGEKERYVDTASYVLSNMDLAENQIYEMEAAGIPYNPTPSAEEAGNEQAPR